MNGMGSSRDAVVLAVLRDADDRRVILIAEELEPLADGVAAGEELAGHGFVDDRDERRPGSVRRLEDPSLDERDPDRVEVIRRHRVHLHEHAIARRRVLALGKDAAAQPAGERRRLRDRGLDHPGHAGDTLDRLLVEQLPARRRVAFAPEVEVQDQHAFGFEPGLGPLRVAETLQEHGRGDERDQRQRDLGHDQHFTQGGEPRRAMAVRDDRHDLVLERRDDVRSRPLDRRREAEHHARRQRQPHRDQQHPAIDADVVSDRQRQLEIGAHQCRQQPVRQQQSACAADRRQQDAFRQQLTDQPATAGADREPQGDLLAPAPRRGRAAGWRRWRRRSAARCRRRPSG